MLLLLLLWPLRTCDYPWLKGYNWRLSVSAGGGLGAREGPALPMTSPKSQPLVIIQLPDPNPHLHTLSMSSQQSDVVSLWKPSIARHEFRTNPALKGVTTAGFCMGYLQTTVVILPSALANDFEQFCEFNSVACPLLYRSERGEVSAGPLAPASDIRYKTKWNL